MKTRVLRYPLPSSPTRADWLFVSAFSGRRGLPLPSPQRYRGRWAIITHPDDYAEILAYCQGLSIAQGVAPYNPPAID